MPFYVACSNDTFLLMLELAIPIVLEPIHVRNCVEQDITKRYLCEQGNLNGDEVDGYEALLPLDFETNGMIVNDENNATIFRPFPSVARLHAIINAYHSGIVIDFPFIH